MSTFSFHPVKNITMGEGGTTTNDPNLATILRELRNHGMKKMSQHHKSEHSKLSGLVVVHHGLPKF